MNEIVSTQQVENFIFEIRGQKVILDVDLARLYDVEKVKSACSTQYR